jgi:hypothetical protein
MINVTGHILRMVGMLTELFVVWRVCGDNDERLTALITLPGGGRTQVAWLAMAAGLVVWMTGTALVYTSRRSRRPPSHSARLLDQG